MFPRRCTANCVYCLCLKGQGFHSNELQTEMLGSAHEIVHSPMKWQHSLQVCASKGTQAHRALATCKLYMLCMQHCVGVWWEFFGNSYRKVRNLNGFIKFVEWWSALSVLIMICIGLYSSVNCVINKIINHLKIDLSLNYNKYLFYMTPSDMNDSVIFVQW